MNCNCNKKNAVRYYYGIMDSKEEAEFQKHIKKCKACKRDIELLLNIKTINDKKRYKVPSFDSIKFPEIKDVRFDIKDLFPVFDKRVLRYGIALTIFGIIISSGYLLIKNRDSDVKYSNANIKEEKLKLKVEPVQKSPRIEKTVKDQKKSFEKAMQEEKKWCFVTGGALRSQPAVRNGYLYFGSDDKSIYALDSKTGKEIWSYMTGGVISSQPVSKNDHIYITSTDGFLYKFHYKTGNLEWKKNVGNLVLSQIHIDDSNIYAANNLGEILALNKNGDELWRNSIHLIIYSKINGDNKNIYFGTADGKVYSISKANGNINWNYSTTSHFLSSKPLIAGEQLLIGDTAGMLYSFNKSTGIKKWEFKTGYQIITDPVYYNEKIFIASDKLYCIDNRGVELWNYSTAAPVDINFNRCKDIISLVDKENNMYMINMQKGICMKSEKSEQAILSFAFACDKIFAGNRKGEICVLREF